MFRVLVFATYFVATAVVAPDASSILLVLPMLAIVLYNVARINDRFVTMEDVIWLVAYLFFVIAPLQALDNGQFVNDGPTTGIVYRADEINVAMAGVVLFFLAFTVVVQLFGNYRRERAFEVKPQAIGPLYLLAMAAFAAYIVVSGGPLEVLSPRLEKESVVIEPYGFMTLATLLVATLVILSALREQARWTLGRLSLFAGLFLMLAFVANPLNTSRFALLQTWVPVVLIFIRGRVGIGWFYALSAFALFIAFPVLSVTTRVGASEWDAIGQIDFLAALRVLPFVDVFDTFVHCVRYMERFDYYWGTKTLGLIFFFVPRGVWTAKETLGGLDIGAELVDLETAGTDNLSFFVGADFYMDGGLFGCFIGGVLVAALYWRFLRGQEIIVANQALVDYIVISAVPILMRGPAGAIIGLFFCMMLAMLAITRIFCTERERDVQPGVGAPQASPTGSAEVSP